MKYIFITLLFGNYSCFAQMNTDTSSLPFIEIPPYYEEYSPGNVIARLIDGLGYRFHWASNGLRQEELDYMPSTEGQNMLTTLEHIFELSETILNCAESKPNIRPSVSKDRSYEEMRKLTLNNLRAASLKFADMSPKELEACKVIFKRGDKIVEYPFWNMINGQISDAIYHTGQIVSYRRTTGNPLHPNVNVFIGKNR